jgi:hypothetical protein
MHPITLYANHNEIDFYTWGEERCYLPRGATAATLADKWIRISEGDEEKFVLELAKLQAGDVLLFEEVRAPSGSGKPNPTHRHVVRLTQVTRSNDPITKTDQDEGTPVVEIRWAPEDGLPFPLCLWEVEEGGKTEPVSVARGNVVLADYGCTITDQQPEPESVLESGHYRPHLQDRNITYQVPYDHELAQFRPAADALAQNPRKALPVVSLKGGGETWEPRYDLLGSDRFATDFVVELESDRRARLRFGDNVLGKRPAVDTEFKAIYRVGNGRAGNIGAESLTHVVRRGNDIPASATITLRNPLPAEGGSDPEPIEQVQLYAPRAFHSQERAITTNDYADVIQRHPDVQKAVATLRWTGSWYTVFITVDRKGGRPVDALFEADVVDFLERFRLTGHDIEIEAPSFVPLYIALTVHVKPGYSGSAVKNALLEAFSNTDLPGGQRGFFHPDNFTFGQPVYMSKVVAAAMQIIGVEQVDSQCFQRWGQSPAGELQAARLITQPLEIARLDNNPNAPENGRIDFDIRGGL